MAYFDKQEEQYMHEQMKTLLIMSASYDIQAVNTGTMADYVENFQVELQKLNPDIYRHILENYEQDLEDARLYKHYDYEPKDRDTAVRLTRRADLKNRTLVQQLRELCSVRKILNKIKEAYGLDVSPLDDKFISDLRRVFELMPKNSLIMTHNLCASLQKLD